MDEHGLREMLGQVETGRLSRRRFVEAMMVLGLTAPLAAQMLASAGRAVAQPAPTASASTRRGGGGPLRLIYWAAPTLLNPHLTTTIMDVHASGSSTSRSLTSTATGTLSRASPPPSRPSTTGGSPPTPPGSSGISSGT